MSTKDNTSLTPIGTPTVNQTKRLSTIKTPGSPKALKTGGGVKDVVSPGELCGFVRSSPLHFPLSDYFRQCYAQPLAENVSIIR